MPISLPTRGFDRYVIALFAVLLLAAGLRFHGLDWDAGQHQHPDERHISDVLVSRIHMPPRHGLAGLFNPATSDLNPRSVEPGTDRPRQFAYGSLPLLLTDGVACVLERLSGNVCGQHEQGTRYWTTYQHQYLLGRGLTVLADLALIVMAYLLARRAFGPLAGLLAAFFLAVSTLNIQLAHFFATDTWSALFATAALWALYRAANDGPFASWRDWTLAGIFIGASIASKPNTMSLVVPALVAIWYSTRGEMSNWFMLQAWRTLVLGCATVAAFALLEPYALPALSTYMRDFTEQADIIGGKHDVPFTRQFTGMLPVWHYLWNVWGYGLGSGLTVLGLAGLAAATWRAWHRRSGIDLLLLSWFLTYGVVINTVFAKFLRYTLPLVPVLAILGAALAVKLMAHVWPARDRFAAWLLGGRWIDARGWRVLAAAPFVLGLLQALTFSSIYQQTHTRVAASEWIYTHVPRGSNLAVEAWDDTLPLGLPDGRHPGAFNYRFIEANHYHDRSGPQGLTEIERILSESDYIVIASQRIYGSTGLLPWRYPVVNRYYDLLFAERLGFTLVYANEFQPRLGPLHLDSRWADESFSVYDHPPVRIYQKQMEVTGEHLDALFAQAVDRQPVASRTPPEERSLLLTEPLWTWPDLSHEEWAGPPGSSWWALAHWLLALALVTVAGVPWAVLLFRRLADCGIGLARIVSLLLVGYVVWLGSSLRWTTASAGLVLLVTLLLGAAGWLVLSRRPGVMMDLRARWPAIAVSETVFWVAFGVALLLRLANPDLWHPSWGGEKPMETAYLNAVLRSAYFPPYDPWFSGGYINYYYFGYVLVGIPIKLSGVATAISFNLAIATLYGMVAAGACSLGQTLARALAGRERPPRTRLVSLIGIGASVLMVGIGNLDGAVQQVQRLGGIVDPFPFWRSSRVIQFVITEFPYFSFLFADLHAHVLAMPLALLIIGLALSIVLTPLPKWQGLASLRQAPWAAVGLSGLTLGALAATNAWDVPAYTGVIAGAGFIGAPFARQAIPRRLAWGMVMAGLAAVLAYLLFLPFFISFQSFYGSIDITHIPTRLPEFLAMWGYLVALTLLVAAVLLVRHVRLDSMREVRWPVVTVVLLTALATGAVIARGLWAPAIVFPIIGLLLIAWLRARLSPAGELVLVLLIGALAIIAGVEFVFIVDFLKGGDWYRMNTVFKLYLEAWLLLAIGLAGGLAISAREWDRIHPFARGLGGTLAVLGLVASLAYPVLVTPDRLRQRFDVTPGPTLNGLAFMEEGQLRDAGAPPIALDEDLAAVYWMQANLSGAPVVVEAAIGPYRGNGSRISNATGFPTILGWDNHQRQQRWPQAIPERNRDVRAIYTSVSSEETLALLEKYDVEYIVVGQVERLTRRDNEPYASEQGLATLRRLAAEGALTEAFRQGETVIYRVERPLAFPGARAAAPASDRLAMSAGHPYE